MLKKVQKFVSELQKSDETIKKRWLVILTSITMILVIGLWSVYINITVKNLSEQRRGGLEFSQTFKNGLKIISRELTAKLSGWVAKLQSAVNKTNSITIQRKDSDFIKQP